MQNKTTNSKKAIGQVSVSKKPKTKHVTTKPNTAKTKPTKSTMILTLLRRAKGASLAELSTATGWMPHSVRGFLSGTVKKKMELTLSSTLNKKGQRRYYLSDNVEIGS